MITTPSRVAQVLSQNTHKVLRPGRWDIKLIRDFIIFIGPVSSIFDFLTFFIMLQVFHASAPLFQTGWFVESLATQTLVLFITCTAGNPLRSRPSLPITITVFLIVGFGMLLSFTPLWPRHSALHHCPHCTFSSWQA